MLRMIDRYFYIFSLIVMKQRSIGSALLYSLCRLLKVRERKGTQSIDRLQQANRKRYRVSGTWMQGEIQQIAAYMFESMKHWFYKNMHIFPDSTLCCMLDWRTDIGYLYRIIDRMYSAYKRTCMQGRTPVYINFLLATSGNDIGNIGEYNASYSQRCGKKCVSIEKIVGKCSIAMIHHYTVFPLGYCSVSRGEIDYLIRSVNIMGYGSI